MQIHPKSHLKNTQNFVIILRTPLNAIIGYSEILMEDYEDDLEESDH